MGPQSPARRACGKAKLHLSEGEAQEIAQRLARRGDAMNAYHCAPCGTWHVGHALPVNAIRPEEMGIPESIEVARGEATDLKEQIVVLNNSLSRLKDDVTLDPREWNRKRQAIHAKLRPVQERMMFLRTWIEANSPPKPVPPPRLTGEDLVKSRANTRDPDFLRLYKTIKYLINDHASGHPGLEAAIKAAFTALYHATYPGEEGLFTPPHMAGVDLAAYTTAFEEKLARWATMSPAAEWGEK